MWKNLISNVERKSPIEFSRAFAGKICTSRGSKNARAYIDVFTIAGTRQRISCEYCCMLMAGKIIMHWISPNSII